MTRTMLTSLGIQAELPNGALAGKGDELLLLLKRLVF